MNRTLSKEYLQDVLVRLAHHSSAIEGNTISLADTVSIIIYNKVTGSGYDLREIYEIKNHEQTFQYMLEQLEEQAPISIALVKEIHAKLTDKLQYDRGEFKTGENAILGADFQTASPAERPILMQQWVDNLNYRLEQDSLDENLRAVAESHIDFERIHPFSDGNARTGRMLMNYALLKNDFPPLIIRADERAQYMQYLATQDSEAFFRFVKDKLEEEKERAKRFQNSEDQKIPYNKNRNAD
ncbi:Fic family protein [Listeria rustica]|uniref:Fic family protein n=1 Tax=Listeria rustica TaxID=2713503 RepID=A0A7W1T7K1_9LIST|nr:Fic family protein [Listeria rustica]MBA3926968.1 Fic family protein [Listeria rustica]